MYRFEVKGIEVNLEVKSWMLGLVPSTQDLYRNSVPLIAETYSSQFSWMNRSELACGTELQLLQDSKLECRTSYVFAHFRAVPVTPWVPWNLERGLLSSH